MSTSDLIITRADLDAENFYIGDRATTEVIGSILIDENLGLARASMLAGPLSPNHAASAIETSKLIVSGVLPITVSEAEHGISE